jgi:hypothetical protein
VLYQALPWGLQLLQLAGLQLGRLRRAAQQQVQLVQVLPQRQLLLLLGLQAGLAPWLLMIVLSSVLMQTQCK